MEIGEFFEKGSGKRRIKRTCNLGIGTRARMCFGIDTSGASVLSRTGRT